MTRVAAWICRAFGTKCRFGSTDEVGLFHLGVRGLLPLLDAAAFLKDRRVGGAAHATSVVMEGNRAVLVEIQVPPHCALVYHWRGALQRLHRVLHKKHDGSVGVADRTSCIHVSQS